MPVPISGGAGVETHPLGGIAPPDMGISTPDLFVATFPMAIHELNHLTCQTLVIEETLSPDGAPAGVSARPPFLFNPERGQGRVVSITREWNFSTAVVG